MSENIRDNLEWEEGLQIIYRTESLWNENELNIQLFLLVCDKDRVLAAKLNDNLIEKRL